jgi:hypothetical protein
MDGKVKVWKVENRELVLSLEGPDEIVVSKSGKIFFFKIIYFSLKIHMYII